MWTTLVLAILCIATHVAARELAVLRSFVALASINRERVTSRLACYDSNGAYDARAARLAARRVRRPGLLVLAQGDLRLLAP